MSLRFSRFSAVLGLLVALFVAVWPALAHAELVRADPAPGSTLQASPAQFRLWFNEPVGVDATVTVVDAAFRRIALTVTAGATADELIGLLDETLPNGVYTLEYDVASADGHTIQGSYQFGVGVRVGRPFAETQMWLSAVSLVVMLAAGLLIRRRVMRG